MTNTQKTAGSKAVDLSSFDDAVKKQEDGIEVKLLSMDGETPLGVTIRVAGPDSARAQKAQEVLADELIEQETLNRIKARDAAQRGIRYLAKITIGWEPAMVVDKQELSYSEENAVKLYTRHRFIRDQVDRAAGNRKRFMKG